jgi:SAM-dependent methyltransferase
MAWQLAGRLGRVLLRAFCKRPPEASKSTVELDSELPAPDAGKLERRFGRDVWREFQGAAVVDFGCGSGRDAVAAAMRGARRVIGIDIQEHRLAAARTMAAASGVLDRCLFLNATTQAEEVAGLCGADVVYSLDAFEHFDDPATVLARMFQLLAPGGRLLVAFGPPWKNPYGSHLRYMTDLPWAHLLFSEATVMAVRARYRPDGARRYADCPGGLNGLTVRGFRRLAAASGFEIDELRTVPLSTAFSECRGLWTRVFQHPWLVEYFTSIVVARMIRPAAAGSPADDPSGRARRATGATAG